MVGPLGDKQNSCVKFFSEKNGGIFFGQKFFNPISEGVFDQRLVMRGGRVFRTPKLFSANLDHFFDLWNNF